MSDHPPSRWLRVALLLMLLFPALRDGGEQERITRSDSVPDLIAAQAPLARVRTEPCCTDLPHVAVVQWLDRDAGSESLVAFAGQSGGRCDESDSSVSHSPRGPPAA